jgi:CHC2 zinc finger
MLIARAKSTPIELELSRRGIKLRRTSEGLAGPCPQCGGADRFSVNTRKQIFNCRGCGGKGDVIDLVRFLDSVNTREAIDTLTNGEHTRQKQATTPTPVVKVTNSDDERERLEGSKAGIEPFKPNGKPKPAQTNGAAKGKIVAIYDYTDHKGEPLYQVCRFEPKGFRQRRPDGKGGWIWSVKDCRRFPYRLADLQKYPDATVFVCEGEKDADRVASLGYCATTVACGDWTDDCVNALAGRDCVILEDNDEAGRKKAREAAQTLHGQANSVRIVRLPDLPEKGDVSDWLDADIGNAGRLVDVCFAAPLWEPDTLEQSTDGKDRLVINKASDHEMCGVEWLWPGRFARGKIALIAGLPDMGKGQIAAFIAAAATAEVPLPCGTRARLAQNEERRCAGGEAGGRRGLGQGEMALAQSHERERERAHLAEADRHIAECKTHIATNAQ